MTQPVHLNEAQTLIAALRAMNLHGIAGVQPTDLAVALAAPATHKQHPLARLVRAVTGQFNDHASQVLANTDAAIRATYRDAVLRQWAQARLKAAALDKDFQNVASTLAELRAAGGLAETGITVHPIPTRTGHGTADFDAEWQGARFQVEVFCKQMHGAEAKLLRDYHTAKPMDREQFIVVRPAGWKKDETTAENVASKFASVKQRAHQASTSAPSIVWVDLQDEDWWSLRPDHAEPVVLDRDQFFTGGLWHAFYGSVGTPFLEYHMLAAGISRPVRRMMHSGLFLLARTWSGAILSFPRCALVRENPNAVRPLLLPIKEVLLGLRWFDLSRSRLDWPPPAAGRFSRLLRASWNQVARLPGLRGPSYGVLKRRLLEDAALIEGVEQRALFGW